MKDRKNPITPDEALRVLRPIGDWECVVAHSTEVTIGRQRIRRAQLETFIRIKINLT